MMIPGMTVPRHGDASAADDDSVPALLSPGGVYAEVPVTGSPGHAGSAMAAYFQRRFHGARGGPELIPPDWPPQKCWHCGRLGERVSCSRLYRCGPCEVEWTVPTGAKVASGGK